MYNKPQEQRLNTAQEYVRELVASKERPDTEPERSATEPEQPEKEPVTEPKPSRELPPEVAPKLPPDVAPPDDPVIPTEIIPKQPPGFSTLDFCYAIDANGKVKYRGQLVRLSLNVALHFLSIRNAI